MQEEDPPLTPSPHLRDKNPKETPLQHFYAFSLFFLCPATLAFVIFMALQAA